MADVVRVVGTHLHLPKAISTIHHLWMYDTPVRLQPAVALPIQTAYTKSSFS